jgi:hypothetical protein
MVKEPATEEISVANSGFLFLIAQSFRSCAGLLGILCATYDVPKFIFDFQPLAKNPFLEFRDGVFHGYIEISRLIRYVRIFTGPQWAGSVCSFIGRAA